MIVAIPADTESLDSDVCLSFGRAPYYLIYDTRTRIPSFIENEAANSQGGAGIQASQTLVDQQVHAVLTPRCGKNAADVLRAAGIRIYHSQQGSLLENLKEFEAGKLDLFEKIHAGLHRHGGI
jgi:predicted Fe-Mo cluster-binding NifX family protein